MGLRVAGILVALGVVAATAFLVLSGSDETDSGSGQAEAPRAERRVDVAEATCSTATGGPPRLWGRRDVVFDLFALMGARQTARRRRDAFDGHGYKVPATLPWGTTATLSVPMALRSRVGLVYSLATQERVAREGVGGADPVVRFTACPTGGELSRTGWAGGVVVDRPRCATLVVKIAGRGTMRRRVPLGRPCGGGSQV